MSQKCGKIAEAIIPRWGMSLMCVLENGHEGECHGGGTCFKHGDYVGIYGCRTCFAHMYERPTPSSGEPK